MSSNGKSYSGFAKVILCEKSFTGTGFDCEAFLEERPQARFVFSWAEDNPPKIGESVEVTEGASGEYLISLEDRRRRLLFGARTYFYLHH